MVFFSEWLGKYGDGTGMVLDTQRLRAESVVGPPPTHWRDRLYAALRCVCFLFAVVFGWASTLPTLLASKIILLCLFFGFYSVICYGVWRYCLPNLPSNRFHVVVNILDLLFVIAMLAMTGGPDSPLSRGLYIWVAMAAIIFGYVGGWLAAVARRC